MSNRIERPTFSEGQILGANDLTATVDYARGQQSRHNRYLHTWGIANGLQLSGKDKTHSAGNAPYQEITLSAGLAIDGRGRELIVPEPVRLSEDDFNDLNIAIAVSDPADSPRYPVFLIGRDTSAPPPPFSTGDCASGEPTRIIEQCVVTFGRPGDAIDLDKQSAPPVSEGPGDSTGDGTWQVLLGFVQWNGDISKFTSVSEESDGLRPRYAGALADEVAARSGELLLRTRATSEAKQPTLVIDETEGGELKFGSFNSLGKVIPVFTVNSKGDITADGTLSVKFASGSVQVQSGVIMDGLLLPLPPGIDAEMVESGKIVLHVQVTPHIGVSPLGAGAFGVPLECAVDDDRRVRCQIQWIKLDPGPPALVTEIRAGMCSYIVIASVPAATGR